MFYIILYKIIFYNIKLINKIIIILMNEMNGKALQNNIFSFGRKPSNSLGHNSIK